MDLYNKITDIDLQIQQLNNTKKSIQNVIDSQGYREMHTFTDLFFKAWKILIEKDGALMVKCRTGGGGSRNIDMNQYLIDCIDCTNMELLADEKIWETIKESKHSGVTGAIRGHFNYSTRIAPIKIDCNNTVMFDYKGWILVISMYGGVVERIKYDSNNYITDCEVLVSVNKDHSEQEFSVFKNGDYLTFIKENFIDVLIAKQLEKESQSEIEKIDNHSNRHCVIENF
jgi:hypothetical protein